jgi:CrcB protein
MAAPGVRPPAGAPDAVELAAVFAGGVVGAVARVALADAWRHDVSSWPWATFLVNVLGAFVLGAVAVRFARGPGRAGVPRALLGSGVCGALTTFSTLQLELVLMLRDGETALALGYAVASLAAGLAAVTAGDRLMRARAGTAPGVPA